MGVFKLIAELEKGHHTRKDAEKDRIVLRVLLAISALVIILNIPKTLYSSDARSKAASKAECKRFNERWGQEVTNTFINVDNKMLKAPSGKCIDDVQRDSCPDTSQEIEGARAFWSATQTFDDLDGDGRGNCFYRIKYLRLTKQGDKEWKQYLLDQAKKKLGLDDYDGGSEGYDDPIQDDDDSYGDYDSQCVGDCNDMDNDGRTWNDVDADNDGIYESP